MNWIEKMIAEQCPNGVEKVKVKDTFPRLKGTPITAGLMKEIQKESAPITIFAGGRTIIKAFESDIPKANIITKASVIVQSRGVIDVQFCNTPFTFKNEMWAYTHSNVTSVKYLYYYLKQNIGVLRQRGAEHGSMPQISLTATENMQIPLPPLSIQKEIVSVLDKFSELIEKTDEEIALRQKQYEYYREKLLTFEEGEAEWKSAKDITEVTDYVANGSFADLRNNVQYLAIPDYAILVRTTDLAQNFAGNLVYINQDAYNFLKKSQLFGGEIIINNIGAGVGQTFICPNRKEKMNLGPNSIMVKTKYNKFYYYWLSSKQGQESLNKIISPGAMPKFNKTGFKTIMLPVPSPSRQQDIVDKLDKFEALISKLKEERELRQKQYEYYREKLLTF